MIVDEKPPLPTPLRATDSRPPDGRLTSSSGNDSDDDSMSSWYEPHDEKQKLARLSASNPEPRSEPAASSSASPPAYAPSRASAAAAAAAAARPSAGLPSYGDAARPHPSSLGVFSEWAQHDSTQNIRLTSRVAFSSKVFATDMATDVTILQWKSLTHRYTSVFRPSTFLVENARTNEPLLEVRQDKASMAGYDGNWTLSKPGSGEVLCTLSGALTYGFGFDDRMRVSFVNAAGGGGRRCLSLNYDVRGRWDLIGPDGAVCAKILQEGTFSHQARVTVPPYVDTLFIVALAMVTREEDMLRQRRRGGTGPIGAALTTAGVPQGMGILGNVAGGVRGAPFGTDRRAQMMSMGGRDRAGPGLIGGLAGAVRRPERERDVQGPGSGGLSGEQPGAAAGATRRF